MTLRSHLLLIIAKNQTRGEGALVRQCKRLFKASEREVLATLNALTQEGYLTRFGEAIPRVAPTMKALNEARRLREAKRAKEAA